MFLWDYIRMFAEPSGPHHRPHFHAYYQDQVGIYAVDKIEKIAVGLPPRQERLAFAWAEIHQEELLKNWHTLQEGRPPNKINPLR